MKFKSSFLAIALILFSVLEIGIIPRTLSQSSLVDETICGVGKREAYFETEVYLIYICRENKKLFYLSFLKSNPQQWFRIPTKRIKKNKYQSFYQGKFLEINPKNLLVKFKNRSKKPKKDEIISSQPVILFVPKKKKALHSSNRLEF